MPTRIARTTAAKPAVKSRRAAKTANAPRQQPTATRASAKAPARKARAAQPDVSKAIRHRAGEAEYSGRTFRSRLEARWAVLFDLLGLDWDYEVAWFPVGESLGYLAGRQACSVLQGRR